MTLIIPTLLDSSPLQPSTPPYDKPMQITNNRLHQKMRTSRTTRMTMEHSSTQLSSSANVSVETTARQNPRVHPEEPFLYYIPEGVHPIYRPLPLLVKLFVLLFSMWTSALTTWKRLSWVQPLAVLRGLLEPPRIADILSFAAKVSHWNWFVV